MATGYGKCLLKPEKFRNYVFYSARCKKVGVLPCSLRIRSPVASARGHEIARNAGYKFLNERLRLANRKVEQLEDERKWTEIGLKRALSEVGYERLKETSKAAAEKAFVRTRENQKRKFNRQITDNKRRKEDKVDKGKWVVNLSKRPLSENEKKVLELGMKFAPAPKKLPTVEIVARVEDALLRNAKPAEAEQARAAVSRALKRAKLPKSNVRKEEWEAVSRLRNDTSIVVLEADKGNATVVMDAEEYEEKALNLIGKPPFKKLTRYPTKSNEKRVNDELKRLMIGGRISQKTFTAHKEERVDHLFSMERLNCIKKARR